MRKSRLLALMLLFLPFAPVKADEGMWLLPLLEKMNSGRMTEMGFQITPQEIYDLNNASLKDAVVIFGNGCTGEIVSEQGLLFTNHHCGYSAIQQLSSVEHNYLKDGFWAMNTDEELPAEGLTVRFLESFTDVTAKVEGALKKSKTDEDKVEALEKLQDKLSKKAGCDGHFVVGQLTSFYGGNTYYFIVYKVFRDIRFVGAPPTAIGKFGADTDNWMWPRHTGDFSIFRVYADKDNNPADYSEDNVPYTPVNHLRISLAGYEQGSPVMIMGYPGTTNRFMTASELREATERNEAVIKVRTLRQDILMADMEADPKIMIQYADKYANSSNGWKKWIGMNETFAKLGVEQRRAAEEKAFTEWVNAGGEKRIARYGSALSNVDQAIAGRRADYMLLTYLRESIGNIELMNVATYAKKITDALAADEAERDERMAAVRSGLEAFYKDYSMPTDKKVAVAMLQLLKESIPAENLPSVYGVIDSCFGSDINAYVEDLYSRSLFTSAAKVEAAVESGDTAALTDDPACELRRSFLEAYNPHVVAYNQYAKQFAQGKKDYIAGTLEMREGEAIYPDANFTMRLTYGQVLPYYPRDAVFYNYYTTLDGVMEKDDPDSWEFAVPERLKELWRAQDYGRYGLDNGKMPVAFISNLDITGGNSGSPIMNSRGELIGLAFDGNWESMSGDIIFEPELQRTISVDIRYVLFIIDKFGGATNLIEELDIVE
ncbi:MAG TPA: S46 family peptidase [Candidatus Coprenecus stercoravium]|uniref:Dipeptidyl-peptidase n=1 Tax=Candidatus Coprenecus stercoravium TaxID=2840735 RepID=A0A9D2GQS5_9BACT|nr:S46 family peptidase [Candidatus Coprenecus stercoravium]